LWILTNSHLRPEIVRQLPQVPKAQILAEPEQRNTAPAIGLAAHIIQSIDPDAVMGVFPSDHIIERPRRYLQFVRSAFRAAEKGDIAVLGLAPRRPRHRLWLHRIPERRESRKLRAVARAEVS
jgi:mannose-1-phosphate guanylyltransferase